MFDLLKERVFRSFMQMCIYPTDSCPRHADRLPYITSFPRVR